MKRLLSIVTMLGLTGLGLNLAAQQTQSSPSQAGSMPQQQQTDATNPQQSARSFEGKSVKVMATVDPNTNTLHIVDITPAESR